MNIYIYVKTGHNVGLEQLRRGAVLYKQLEYLDPILCTCDFRAATFAKDLGVKKGMGVDIIGNLPNIMQRGDILIFESNEPSDTMLSFMKDYCTKLFEVGVDIPKIALIDDKFFQKGNQSILKTFFFGDDDYNDILLKELCTTKVDIDILMGHYYFLGNEDKLKPYFNNIIDEENYFETILNTKYLLTSSVNAVFESLASGNYPVFYQRDDKNIDDLELLKKYNIPIIEGNNLKEIVDNFNNIIKIYPQTNIYQNTTIKYIINTINKLIS